MKIERVKHVDESLVADFKRLVPQLTGRDEYPSSEELKKVVDRDFVHLYVAKDNDVVIGTLTLVFIRIPTGIRVWIEDVIVDENARGEGVGTALIWHALQTARINGVLKVDLFSNPKRIAANNLYLKMGFKKRESNVYRYYINEM